MKVRRLPRLHCALQGLLPFGLTVGACGRFTSGVAGGGGPPAGGRGDP